MALFDTNWSSRILALNFTVANRTTERRRVSPHPQVCSSSSQEITEPALALAKPSKLTDLTTTRIPSSTKAVDCPRRSRHRTFTALIPCRFKAPTRASTRPALMSLDSPPGTGFDEQRHGHHKIRAHTG